jgi:CubicO group peptidase (beta-lactamase class C family)/D-alanyl-D-alanine dipeptidase
MRRRNKAARRALFAVSAGLCLALLRGSVPDPSVSRGTSGPSTDYSQVSAALKKFIQHEIEDKSLPAFSIALVDNQQIVWAKSFGYADPGAKIGATPETVYRIGSVSKLFTDIAVMQLVERRELDLDAPVESYVPEFHPRNPFGKPITLRELMSHRSGLLREPPVGNYFDSSDPPLKAVVESLSDTTLIYPPGLHTKYSNAGVAVVGYVLERQTGQPFAAYVKRAVLDPAGLDASAFTPEPELIERLAHAFMWSYDGLFFRAPTFELGMAPAGSMYSTVLDLGRFLSVLFNGGRGIGGEVLKPETFEQMWTPQFPKPRDKTGYGIGFRITDMDGHREVGHAGAIYGFSTQLAALPDDKIGAVAVTTLDSANAVTRHVAEEALRLMLAAKRNQPLPGIPTTSALPPERVRGWEGRYGTGSEAVDLVSKNGELFLLPAAGGEETRLRQLGDALIVDDRTSYGQKVIPVEDGIRIGDQLLPRVSPPVPAPPPERWKGLIGEYGWDYDKLYILERAGKLNALIEWFDYAPLTEISSDTFEFPHEGLYDGEQAVFTRGRDGEATQVRISGVVFRRRPIGDIAGGVFRVQPQKPLEVLSREALAAQPPREKGDFLKPDLVEVSSLDPSIRLDIRYATKNDFLGEPVYSEAKAYLERPAAEALVRASQELKSLGYGLLIHDAYRPWYVTKIFWDATPPEKRIFVADPNEGSRHNRGCAVDLTLYELKTGREAEMTGVYDEMSERSYPFYPGGTSLERSNRDLLRHAMEQVGFRVYEFEWWHFDYKDWQRYPILNLPFEKLGAGRGAASPPIPPGFSSIRCRFGRFFQREWNTSAISPAVPLLLPSA